MKVRMNVSSSFTVDLETGIINGRTYPSKEWIKRNFSAKWDKDNKVWVADPAVIKEEFKNRRYYEIYIEDLDEFYDAFEAENAAEEAVEAVENVAEEEEVVVEEATAAEESVKSAIEKAPYLGEGVFDYKELVASRKRTGRAAASDEVLFTELVNGCDGFYRRIVYKSGRVDLVFIG